MTMEEKVCRKLYATGKWREEVCEAFCSKEKRLKCSFLDKRILEEANKG